MAVELGGTKSAFGEQVLACRPTSPTLKFGSSTRTEQVFNKSTHFKHLGEDSPGASYSCTPAFGPQPSSTKKNSPSHQFPHSSSDGDVVVLPGPGHYEIHQQSLGVRPASARVLVGRSNRWNEFAPPVVGPEVRSPTLQDIRDAPGRIGEAQAYSFTGQGQRADIANNVPGLRPTRMSTPGPGAYVGPTSSFGGQVVARKAHQPRTTIGHSPRGDTERLFLSSGHERVLLGRGSPGPCSLPGTSALGTQVRSTKQSHGGFSFGTSNRFSFFKAVPVRGKGSPAKQNPRTHAPGAGDYGV